MDTLIALLVLLLLLGLSLVIWLGKGDGLIAGYNTASPRERERYDIRRLRRVTGGVVAVVGVAVSAPLLLGYGDDARVLLAASMAVVPVAVAGVVVANTWCRKK